MNRPVLSPMSELDHDVPPGIALAVGKKAVAYSPMTGMQAGEDVMKMFFEEDLGFDSEFFFFFFFFFLFVCLFADAFIQFAGGI